MYKELALRPDFVVICEPSDNVITTGHKGKAPEGYDFWDFGTNAVTPVSMGIPAIGFGLGEYKLAHMRDENCATKKISEAARFYAELIGKL